jgi:hypothetical protein
MIKSFGWLGMTGNLLISRVASSSNARLNEVEGHEQNLFVQRFLK